MAAGSRKIFTHPCIGFSRPMQWWTKGSKTFSSIPVYMGPNTVHSVNFQVCQSTTDQLFVWKKDIPPAQTVVFKWYLKSGSPTHLLLDFFKVRWGPCLDICHSAINFRKGARFHCSPNILFSVQLCTKLETSWGIKSSLCKTWTFLFTEWNKGTAIYKSEEMIALLSAGRDRRRNQRK